MSSSRFPGKVLAPFRGEPIIAHVMRAAAGGVGEGAVVLATSEERADDPLAAYVERLGVPVFRGALDDVVGRFQACANEYPADWILRVCADSPLLDPAVIRLVLAVPLDDLDVITTTSPRTFAKGQNVELIRADALLGLSDAELTDDDREHVTPFFYRHPDRYRVHNVESDDPERARDSVVVDTLEDLRRLEALA
jgi:spore coat polysaccharide biosynthesis protein SpsF